MPSYTEYIWGNVSLRRWYWIAWRTCHLCPVSEIPILFPMLIMFSNSTMKSSSVYTDIQSQYNKSTLLILLLAYSIVSFPIWILLCYWPYFPSCYLFPSFKWTLVSTTKIKLPLPRCPLTSSWPNPESCGTSPFLRHSECFVFSNLSFYFLTL